MDKRSEKRGSWVRETHLQRPRCKELGEFGKLKRLSSERVEQKEEEGSGEWGDSRLERGREQVSEDMGDNVDELVIIPRAVESLWRPLAGASDDYVCIQLK